VSKSWSQVLHIDHRNPELSYGGLLFDTPVASVLGQVERATVHRSGLVVNGSGAHTFDTWYWEADAKKGGPRVNMANCFKLDRLVLSILIHHSENFQHTIFQTLPAIAFVCQFLLANPTVLVLTLASLARDLVREVCPLPADRFLLFPEDSKCVSASVVYVPYYESKDPAVKLKMGMVPPRSLVTLGPLAPGTDIVYLPRPHGKVRSVKNEGEVLATLRAFFPGLIVHVPTEDWRRDREALKNARIVIAPHGGACSNMIFAPANATFVELTPLLKMKREGVNERPCYFGLAHALGFTYHAIEPMYVKGNSNSFFDDRIMTVPVAAVRATAEIVARELIETKKRQT
jgi:capsular polysaccharide biosynthesis protein